MASRAIELDGKLFELPEVGSFHEDLSQKLKSEIYIISLKMGGISMTSLLFMTTIKEKF